MVAKLQGLLCAIRYMNWNAALGSYQGLYLWLVSPAFPCNMKRLLAYSLVAWLAAAILILGGDSPPMIALSGVVALGGFDLLRP